MELIRMHDRLLTPVRLLGHGKGGYSWLVSDETGELLTLKRIHHEPCDYYTFGDKLQSELNDYARLSEVGLPMPRMIDWDREQELILKEYIPGEHVLDRLLRGENIDECIRQVREMSALLTPAGLNIDWFPTNFLLRDGTLLYVDYECNGYMPEWNLENWGLRYWAMTPELTAWLTERERKRKDDGHAD